MIFAQKKDIHIQKLNELLKNKTGFYWSDNKLQQKTYFIFEHADNKKVTIKTKENNVIYTLQVSASKNLYFQSIIEYYEFQKIKDVQLNNCYIFLDESFYYRKNFVFKGLDIPCDTAFDTRKIDFIFSPSVKSQESSLQLYRQVDKIKFKEIQDGFSEAKRELVFEKINNQRYWYENPDQFICEFFVKNIHYLIFRNEDNFSVATCSPRTNKIYVDYFQDKQELINHLNCVIL